MIEVTPEISLSEDEISEDFVRSSGPGGQNVNKVATAVQLRFDLGNSDSLPPDVKKRLIHLAGKRLTDKGILIIDARRFRTQDKNRQDAMERLLDLIRKAAIAPRVRRKTKPTANSRQRRLESKRQQSLKKQFRSKNFPHQY